MRKFGPQHSISLGFVSVNYFILGHTVLALYHDGDDYMNRIGSKSRQPFMTQSQLMQTSIRCNGDDGINDPVS